MNDEFVQHILEGPPTEVTTAPLREPQRSTTQIPAEHGRRHMFRYSLLFINFTFVVASILLIMAGVVMRANGAIQFCKYCSSLAVVAIVAGSLLWLFAMFGFRWIRDRNVLFLLIFVGFLSFLTLVLLGMFIASAVFASRSEPNDANDMQEFSLEEWIRNVNTTGPDGYSQLCALQSNYKCSGFKYGCCVAGNGSNEGVGCYNRSNVPEWVPLVCPFCPVAAATVCTEEVYHILQLNLGAFLLTSCSSMVLVIIGIVLAVLSRHATENI